MVNHSYTAAAAFTARLSRSDNQSRASIHSIACGIEISVHASQCQIWILTALQGHEIFQQSRINYSTTVPRVSVFIWWLADSSYFSNMAWPEVVCTWVRNTNILLWFDKDHAMFSDSLTYLLMILFMDIWFDQTWSIL